MATALMDSTLTATRPRDLTASADIPFALDVTLSFDGTFGFDLNIPGPWRLRTWDQLSSPNEYQITFNLPPGGPFRFSDGPVRLPDSSLIAAEILDTPTPDSLRVRFTPTAAAGPKISLLQALFSPCCFWLAVDYGPAGQEPIRNVQSPMIYIPLSNSDDPPEFTLSYVPSPEPIGSVPASFFLSPVGVEAGGAQSIPVIKFQPILCFTDMNLLIRPGEGFVFADPPLQMARQPDWLTWKLRSDGSVLIMSRHIQSTAVGFSFQIDYAVNGRTYRLVSPDPIIVNATIGDG